MRTFAEAEKKAHAFHRTSAPRSAVVFAISLLLSASALFAPLAHGQSGYALCQLIQSVSPGDTYPVDNPSQIKPGIPNYSCNESPTDNGAFVSLLHFSNIPGASTSDFRAGQWNGAAAGLGNSSGTAEDSNLSVVFFRRNCYIAEVSSTDAATAQRVAIALDGKLKPLPCASSPATPPPAATRAASFRLVCDKGLPLPLVIGAEPSQPCTLWIYDWSTDVRQIEVLFPDKVDSYGRQPDGIRISTVGEGTQSTNRMSGSYSCPESGHDRCYGWALLVEAMRQTLPGPHTSRIQVRLDNGAWNTLQLNTVASVGDAPPTIISKPVIPQQDITGTWVDEDGTQVTISNTTDGTTLLQYHAGDRFGTITGRFVGTVFKGTYETRNGAGSVVATGTQTLTLTADGFLSGPWVNINGRRGSFNLTRVQVPLPNNPPVPRSVGNAGNQAKSSGQPTGRVDITGAWVGSSGVPATISSAGGGNVVIQYRQPTGNGIITGTWNGRVFQGTYVTQDDSGRVIGSGKQALTLDANGELSGPWQSSEGRGGVFTLVRPAPAAAPSLPVQPNPVIPSYPDIGGVWYREGDRARPASIEQTGGTLALTNEAGARSRAYFSASNVLVAQDWSNLAGNLVTGNTRINWANGSTWLRNPVQEQPAGPGTILGTWYREGDRSKPASIQQSSAGLILTNEAGGTVQGQIQNGAIVADGWGGMVGRLVNGGTRINWSNGSSWQR